MWRKNRKNSRTASLKPKFTGSYEKQKKVYLTCHG